MDRIKRSHLDGLIRAINRKTNSPESSYTRTKDGKFTANIGNYHLSGAYGGVSLHRISNPGGGVEDVFSCGHVPKRDLYNRLRAFLEGLERHNIAT